MTALLLSADLMMTSQVAGAAARQQVELITVGCAEQLIENAAGTALVILDLSAGGLEVAPILEALKGLAEPPGRIVAFGPHVHEQRLAAAREAGCDEVMSRGQFHSTMDTVFASL